MLRLLSAIARAGTAALVGLLVLAVLRWGPVHARPPIDVRALAIAGAAIALAVLACLTGRPRPPRALRPLASALAAALLALAALTGLRPATGLMVSVADPSGTVGTVGPGPIDVTGQDFRGLPSARKWTLRWQGALRSPTTGVYRLWATGRGAVDVAIDGRPVLHGEGESLVAGADIALTRGEHAIEVRLQRTGPGTRLRIGWTRPRADGRPGSYDEPLLPRDLGPALPRAWWLATDALALACAALASLLVWRGRWDVPRALPVAHPMTRAEVGASLVGHFMVVAVMSWPLVTDPAGLGVTDRPDGRLNAWILAWDVHALAKAPARLFHPPIYHPLPDALAFSENLLLPAVLSAPGQLVSPVLGYNLALVISLVVSGLGVQALARRATGDRLAAFVAGVFFAAGAHRWIRLAHLHAQVTLVLPFVLIAFDRFWARRTLPRALLVGALLALQGLASVYLGAITALVVTAAAALALVAGLRAREAGRLALGLALGAALLFPVVRPYLHMRAFQGVEFTIQDVATYATTVESYAAAGTRLWGGLTQKHLDPDRVQDTLFPGLTLLVLGVVGLSAAPPRYRAVAVTASAAAIVFSLGPETAAYRFLHEHVVFVRGVRALSRFSLVPVFALSVLSACALSRRFGLALLALAAFLLESANVPIRYAPATAPSAASRWLARRDGAVADLPLGVRDTEAMLEGTAHFRPLANGDSGFMPRPYTHEMELLQLPLSDDALRYLRAVGVREVVARQDLALTLLARFGEERIYAVPEGERAHVVRGGEAVPTRFARQGMVVTFATPRRVAALAFEPADAPWIATPRIWVFDEAGAWREVPARASLADATLSLMADPRHGRGEVVFAPVVASRIRMDPALPARGGAVEVR